MYSFDLFWTAFRFFSGLLVGIANGTGLPENITGVAWCGHLTSRIFVQLTEPIMALRDIAIASSRDSKRTKLIESLRSSCLVVKCEQLPVRVLSTLKLVYIEPSGFELMGYYRTVEKHRGFGYSTWIPVHGAGVLGGPAVHSYPGSDPASPNLRIFLPKLS